MVLGRWMRDVLFVLLAVAALASFLVIVVFVAAGSATAHRIGLALACVSVGGIGVMGAVQTLREDLPVLLRWRRVPATVTLCERDASDNYRIDVVYRPVPGRAFIGTLCMPRRRRAGAPIRIRVDPADPGRIRADITLRGFVRGIAIFCTMGALAIPLAVYSMMGGLPDLR